MDTDDLIDALVNDLNPVQPLAPAWLRVAHWLAIGLPVIVMVVLGMGIRPDLEAKVTDWIFVNQELAMLATAVVGAWAALSAGIPGTARWALYLPAIPLLGWVAALGYQYGQDWLLYGITGPALWFDLECIPGIAMTAIAPMAAMVVMLRNGTASNRGIAVFWGALASAALANAGLRLFHPVDAALMVIVWQFGTVIAFTAIGTLARDALVPVRKTMPASP